MDTDILVLGGDHHNTLGVIRSLGFMGIKSHVILAPAKTSYVIKSRYVAKYDLLPSLDKVIPMLRSIAKDKKDKITIICCSDAISSILDLNRDELKKFFYLPYSGNYQGYLTEIMDKGKMLEIARNNMLPIPETWDNISDVKFPCIIKPLVSKDGTKDDIQICHSLKEFSEYMQQKHNSKAFQYQEFIDKSLEFQLIGLSLNEANTVIIPGYSEILRSPKSTNTGFLKYHKLEDLKFKYLDNCKSFLRELKYTGLFSIEFIRDHTGHDFFMEINLRNDGNAICVTASGVNLPYIWYFYNKHNFVPQIPMAAEKEVFVMPEIEEFCLVFIKKEISFQQWIKDIKHTNCFMEFSIHDPIPALYKWTDFLISIITSKLKKFKRPSAN